MGQGGDLIRPQVKNPYIYTLLYIKQSTRTYRITENSPQYSVTTSMGKESAKKRYINTIAESLCCTPETNTTL